MFHKGITTKNGQLVFSYKTLLGLNLRWHRIIRRIRRKMRFVFWRASILQPVIVTLICMFGSTMCDDAEYTTVGSDGATTCPSATPVSSARSDIECAVACTGNPNCRSFGYAKPFGEGSCLVSESDNCTLVRGGRTYRKKSDCSFSASGPMAIGTTVMFMQRYVGDVSFARLWSDYDNGFGNCSNGDFWLGLRNIKTLLGSTSATWRVEMKQWSGVSMFVEFNGFTVGDSSTNYLMNYAAVGDRSSTIAIVAADNNAQFSTMDRDNDKWSHACTQLYNGNGGFWFNGCGNAFPTAAFPPSQNTNQGYMIWATGSGYVSLREIRMYLKR